MNSSERAVAALYGLAIGDALGMPTQLMSRTRVRETFGSITRFEPARADHPIAAGMPAGSITDDTEQALLLAKLLIAGSGHVDAAEFARELIVWENDMRARGSLDLLGPSTKAAVTAVTEGVALEDAGRYGTTNGAAMRITPVGISVGTRDLSVLVDRVEEASRITHNTGVAIAGASAVAAAISVGIEGADVAECMAFGALAARQGSSRGHWVAAADVGRRIEWAVASADPADTERSLTDIAELIGTSLATQESVPAAFGVLATFPEDPWGACCAAATLGGDTDTIAAMVGAIAGASHGRAAFPNEARRTIDTVNDLDLADIAHRLRELR